MNAYLAPEQRRWQPRTEQDITDAIDGGLIAETHYFDAKREVGPSPGDRKELGRDLASFAIDVQAEHRPGTARGSLTGHRQTVRETLRTHGHADERTRGARSRSALEEPRAQLS